MIYQIKREQLLNCTLDEAWEFFSTPRNLEKMTPKSVGFKITHLDSEEMHQGQIIGYKIMILPKIWVNWLTEITFVEHKKSFIDDQRVGPYKVWHHTHRFEQKGDKVLMTDNVTYVLPFGLLGKVVNFLFVGKQINSIFDERKKLTEEIFT